ncbi:hypothetical protein [Zobellia barbeyronii]|nr:hypothetical protein [Zobellia barbeyronii]
MNRTHHQVKAEKAKKAWMSIQDRRTPEHNKPSSVDRQLQKV